MRKTVQYSICLLFILGTSNSGSILAQKNVWRNFIQSANLKYATVGIKIVDVSNGKSIYAYNENRPLCPASCIKLVTTATALEVLGENYTYKTTVFTDGTINQQGALNGNLYIQGTGDPTLGSEYIGKDQETFMDEWFTAISKHGIKTISGSVIALDQQFGYEGISPYWMWMDLGNYYASGVYGLSIFDNMYYLYLRSGAAGTTPQILRWKPQTLPLHFENNLKAAANNKDSAYIHGAPFSPDRQLFGSMPHNRESFVIKGDIPDPGLFLASYWTDYLQKKGIRVQKGASSYRIDPITPQSVKILATTTSVPLTEIIRIVNFRSNNHYAEHLFRKLTQEEKTKQGIKDYWTNKGLETGGLYMYDGSGLAPIDATTPAFLTDLLVYMNNKSKSATAFYKSLPLSGIEGTVSGFLKNTSLEGKARVKSGSMENVMSYSGYIDTSGKRYAFTIIVNKFTGSRSVLRSQVEQLLVGMLDHTKSDI